MPDSLEYKPRGGTAGAGTTMDSRFSTSGLSYPSDLLADSNQYGGNYVIFYINVHEDSKLVKNGSEEFVSGGLPPRAQGDLKAANISSVTYATMAAGAGAAAANTADVAGKTAGMLGVDLSKNGAAVLNTGAGMLAGAAVVAAIGGPKAEYKTMKKAIALHIPTDLSIKYGMKWRETDLAGTMAMAAIAENGAKMVGGAIVGGALGGLIGGPKGAAAGAALGAIPGAVGAAGAAGSYGAGLALETPGVGEALGKSSGTARNPKREQLFKEVDYRTFTFSYQFFPRNAAEAASVREIIKQFKIHMHPEYRDANHFLYIYPSEFDIFYYQNGKENMNLHRHTSCVLTDLSVSYAPQGTFSTFENGMPTQMNVQMTFMELALLSRDEVMDGF